MERADPRWRRARAVAVPGLPSPPHGDQVPSGLRTRAGPARPARPRHERCPTPHPPRPRCSPRTSPTTRTRSTTHPHAATGDARPPRGPDDVPVPVRRHLIAVKYGREWRGRRCLPNRSARTPCTACGRVDPPVEDGDVAGPTGTGVDHQVALLQVVLPDRRAERALHHLAGHQALAQPECHRDVARAVGAVVRGRAWCAAARWETALHAVRNGSPLNAVSQVRARARTSAGVTGGSGTWRRPHPAVGSGFAALTRRQPVRALAVTRSDEGSACAGAVACSTGTTESRIARPSPRATRRADSSMLRPFGLC